MRLVAAVVSFVIFTCLINRISQMTLQNYLLPTIGSTVIMGMCYLLGLYGQSCVWVLVLVGLSILKTHMWRKRQKRIMALQAAALREREVIMAQFQDLPAWVNFPDTERVEWLNKVVLQLWPYVGEYGKKFMQEFVVPQVKMQMPSAFRSFKFTKMDMGDIPCRVGGIKVYTHNVGRDRIIIDMDVAYAGDCDFTVSVAGFTGGLNQLQFSGKLRAVLKPLLPYPPMVGGISAYFLEPPKIDFNLTGVGEMVELPGLMNAFRSVLNTQVCNICVLPNEIFVPLVPNIDATKLYFSEPDGVIRLKIIEAKDLENRDITFIKKGVSDPYCEIQVGAQYFKTRTINNNLNPIWNEYFEAIVDEADGQKLRIELFDKDTASSDEELGRLAISLDMIKRAGTINKWYQLEGCEHGDIHLKVSWFDLSKEKDDFNQNIHENDWLNADKPIHPALLLVFIDNVSELPYPKAKLEPSPYVEVSVGNEKMKTPVKEKTINPLYQSRFAFFIRHPVEQELNIQAIDDITRRSLGKFNLRLERLFSEPDLEIYQRTFMLTQGIHQSSIVLTVKLRAIKAVSVSNSDPEGFDSSSSGRIYGNDYYIDRAEKVFEAKSTNKKTSNSSSSDMDESERGIADRSALSVETTQTRLLNNDFEVVRKSSAVSESGFPMVRRRPGFGGKLFSSKHYRKKLINPGSCGKLQLCLHYSQQSCKLVLVVVSAKELRPVDKSGSADPYVSVRLIALDGSQPDQKKKTGIVEKSLTPQFDNHFEFDMHSSDIHNYKILLKVKDSTNYGVFAKPPVLGAVEIRLDNFDYTQVLQNHWVHLEHPSR